VSIKNADMGFRTVFFIGLFFYLSDGDPIRIIGMVLTIFTAFLAMLYFNQENMLYLNKQDPNFQRPQDNPAHLKLRNPSERGMKYEDRYFDTEDGCRLHAWMIYAPDGAKDAPTIIFFHANAGNMGIRLPNVEQIHCHLKCNIFMVSYRGYGNSTGTPNEVGLCIDGKNTVEYVLKHAPELQINPKKIFLFGRSLGGAVAAQTAKHFEDQLCGIILENTFTSIPDMVDTLFPWLSHPWVKEKMLRMKWDTLSIIEELTLPICFFMGCIDEIVPHSHMLKLYKSATKSRFKTRMKIEKGSHNDTWLQGGTEYLAFMHVFMERPECKPTFVKSSETAC